MIKKLFIVEGADGTGKSTLCNALLDATKGHLLHASYSDKWKIIDYHTMMYTTAFDLLSYQSVIFDRWAVSEQVYSNAFRHGSQYSADNFMMRLIGGPQYGIGITNVVFIYCSNDDVLENHKENVKSREEMFEDMSPVVKEYEKYLNETNINWLRYDFNKVDMNKFVEEIVNG